MKTCCRCKTEKDVSEFYKNKHHKDGLSSHCKGCNTIYLREWYEKNHERQLNNVRKAKVKSHQDNQSAVSLYLREHPCVDCGEGDIIVLDFDHVRGEKVAGIAEMVARHRPWAVIAEEISKCEVRCANCHRRRTAKEGKHLRWTQTQ